jgi:hypothetical protein
MKIIIPKAIPMKTLREKIRTVALLFTALILLQGCVAYQNTAVTLEQATQEQKKVKVNTTSNAPYTFKYITYEDGQFFGVKKKSGDIVKLPLLKDDIIKILIQNKSASTWGTIAVIVVPLIALVIIGKDATSFSPDLNL